MSSEKLIIYLNEDDTMQSGVLHATGNFEINSENLHDISHRNFAEIIVIAPPTSVLLAKATLPNMAKQRILQALPFALEDQLLQDVNDLHFVISPLKKVAKSVQEITVDVAIVAKKKVQHWLTLLNAQNIYPTSLLPAPLLVEKEENCWSVCVDNDFSLVHTQDLQGSSCDTTNLSEYLSFKLNDAVEKPQAITLNNFSDKQISLEVEINVITKPTTNKKIIEAFAKNISAPTINLLQGMQQTKRKGNNNQVLWKIIPALAAAWIFLMLLSNSVSYFTLSHKDQTLQAEIKTIYKKNFPNATSVVAAKQRMQDKLKSLSGGSQKNPIFAWLSALAQNATDTPFQIKQMDYRNNVTDIQFVADNFVTVDKIIKALGKDGFYAKQQNVSQLGKTVKGILTISEGNAA